jgi:outer membrane protein assembly factor BamB
MARANVHGTGVYVTAGVRQLTGLRWKFTAGANGSITTPAIQGSAVYFGHDGRVYAVDTATGTERWNRKLDNASTSAPAIAGDTVDVGAWEEFYALSTTTGGVKWIFQPERGSDDGYYIDTVVAGGTVYFGAWHSVYALDSETGQEKWKLKLSAIPRNVPSVYAGTLYVGTFSPDKREVPYLYALDSQTGQEKWKFKATGGGIGGPVAVTDGVVYVSTSDDGLLALDATSGQEKWRYNPGAGLFRGPAVAYGIVYITCRGFLAAVDAQTGQEQWRLPASDALNSDPVIADGTIYFGSTTDNLAALLVEMPLGELHAVDAHSGQELWKFSVDGTGSLAPAVADGTVYFGDSKGTLYAIK